MPPRPPDPLAHPMAVGHGPQQDGSWPMEDRIAGASLGSLPGVKPSADRGCRETDATLLNRDSPFLVAATTMWEIESQTHRLPLGGRDLSIAHRRLSAELAVNCRRNLSRNQPRCPNVRELANYLPVQGREYVRKVPQTPRVALDRPKDAIRREGVPLFEEVGDSKEPRRSGRESQGSSCVIQMPPGRPARRGSATHRTWWHVCMPAPSCWSLPGVALSKAP